MPPQTAWTWLLLTPTFRASKRYAEAPVTGDWGCTTSSVAEKIVVVGTYAESPPLVRRVLTKLDVYSCWMTAGGQGSDGKLGHRA